MAKDCWNKGGRVEEKKKLMNRFEALASRVMQCGIKEVRRQEVVREVVKCFGCRKEGYKKWECPKKNERSRKKEAAPPREVWEKVKLHSGAKELPPRGAEISMEGWMTRREVVTFVECQGCDYKGTKTQENHGQGFLSKKQLLHMWCESCREAKEWREREVQRGRAERVVYSVCDVRDAVKEKIEKNGKGEIFCLPCRTEKKIPWWNWGGELEQSVPRAQRKGAGITDPEESQKDLEGSMGGVDADRSRED